MEPPQSRTGWPQVAGVKFARRRFLHWRAAQALAGAAAALLPSTAFAAANSLGIQQVGPLAGAPAKGAPSPRAADNTCSLKPGMQKSTDLMPPEGFSASDLVFEETFSGSSLNADSWNTFLTSNAADGWPWEDNGKGGSGAGVAYDAEYMMPSQVSVKDGLTLNAARRSITHNGVTLPVTSGAVSSYGKIEFTGGYLQISMKAPAGDGSWPALWLLPGSHAGKFGDNFEIDVQEGGYTGAGSPNDSLAYHLHTSGGVFGGVVSTGIDLTSGFNTYAINWIPGQSITWYVNGKQQAQITSAEAAIPDVPMELIISNGVANDATSAWHTTLSSSTPQSMPMQVNNVQLYQKPRGDKTFIRASCPR